MPDHRICRVHSLAYQKTRQPGDQKPEGGRDDAVAKAFCQAFGCGNRDALLVEPGGIAAHYPRHSRARLCQIPA